MPEYTPPDATNADFTLETYTAPESDTADFQLDPGDRLAAPTSTLALDHPDATISGTGSATLTAASETLVLTHPPAALQTVNRLSAPTSTLALDHPLAAIAQEIVLGAPTSTLALDHPLATIGYGEWVLDNAPIGRVTGETSTNRTLSLTARVTSDALEATLRPLKTDEGKVDVLGTDDGGFVAIDRADGGNTFTLIPPVQRRPLRQEDTVHVERYEESLVSQDVGEWTVELEVVRDTDREDTPSASETPAADEWGFTMQYGTVATSRVDADVVGTGENAVQRFEVTARLTKAQTHVFEAALARLGAGRVREIPDAPNVAVDDSSDDAVTVTVDAPDSQSTVSDGDYIVTAWSSERLTDAYQSVSFTLASK